MLRSSIVNNRTRSYRTLISLFIALALTMLSQLSTACETCILALKEGEKIEKSIRRLSTILRANEEFLADLGPNDNSERMKAQSNINIARKRGAALDAELSAKKSILGTQECTQCLPSGKKEP